MKLTKFHVLSFAAFCIALVSYVSAGNGGHGRGQGRGHHSGPGFNSDNNPGLLGKIGRDEQNDFFTSDGNPGKIGSEFGRATADKASANTELHRNESAPVVDRGPKEQRVIGLFENKMVATSHNKRPHPSPIPSATPGGTHPSPSPIPSATPGGTHPSPSPIPSATPGGDGGPDVLFPIDPTPRGTPGDPHGH